MTKEQFKKLKIGDTVYLPNYKRQGFTSTEVLKIDHVFNKVQVLLRNKFLSYRYFPLKVDFCKVTGMVGVVKQEASSLNLFR